MAAAKLLLAVGAGAVALVARLGLSDQLRRQEELAAVYRQAKAQLDASPAGSDCLLFALGKCALAENANWLQANRKQPEWHGR